MPGEFEVGQNILCVTNQFRDGITMKMLTPGAVYKVNYKGSHGVTVKNDAGHSVSYPSTMFRLMDQTPVFQGDEDAW